MIHSSTSPKNQPTSVSIYDFWFVFFLFLVGDSLYLRSYEYVLVRFFFSTAILLLLFLYVTSVLFWVQQRFRFSCETNVEQTSRILPNNLKTKVSAFEQEFNLQKKRVLEIICEYILLLYLFIYLRQLVEVFSLQFLLLFSLIFCILSNKNTIKWLNGADTTADKYDFFLSLYTNIVWNKYWCDFASRKVWSWLVISHGHLLLVTFSEQSTLFVWWKF